ncbi:MAG: FHA domain-containing protein [Bacteriovoracaceae bacterium]
MAKNVLVLKHFESPKEAGVYFRLVCLTGVSKGESYFLIGNRIVVGRSDKADIRLNDTKTSREHAELSKVGQHWVVTDLGSQNGVILNDQKVTQEQLNEGDKLIIGQTVFKFVKVEVSAKNKVIRESQSNENQQSKSFLPFLILVLILGGLYLFDDEKPAQAPTSTAGTTNAVDPTNEYVTALKKRQAIEDKQLKEKLNVIYQRGLREYREGNYYRAIHEFNLALIIAPGDSQAEYYLRKTKEDLDTSIEGYTAKAQRDEEALKYQSAIVSYCSIIRLLYSVPEDPRYKNAVKQIKDLEGKLGLEQGETNCLKKQRTDQ